VSEDKPPLLELDVRLKEQELRLKEAQIRELEGSKWAKPLVIGLLGATLALFGNVAVTMINNANTQRLERSRNQATLILEAIKTNGDTNAACKNLVFFVSLGLIEDTNHAITGACPGNVQGVPSISVGIPDKLGGTLFYPLVVQTVDDHGTPISNVSVEANLVTPTELQPEFEPWVSSDKGYSWILHQTGSHCVSGKDGNCYLGMAPADKFIAILAKKDGYAGSRTNVFFKGTSIVVAMQKSH
jgi:hypothetical protein